MGARPDGIPALAARDHGAMGKSTARRVRVLLVGADLMGRARVEEAVRRAGGTLVTCAPDELGAALRERDPDVVIVDLDSAGAAAVAAASGAAGPRLLGYFSHVDAALGDAARSAGIDALPRGRFWRELPNLLEG